MEQKTTDKEFEKKVLLVEQKILAKLNELTKEMPHITLLEFRKE